VALLPKLACGTVGIEGKLRLEKQCGGAFVRWTLIFRSRVSTSGPVRRRPFGSLYASRSIHPRPTALAGRFVEPGAVDQCG